jgi:hypothetical protein
MMVWLKAWPMCRVPVTFGGGSWMLKEGLPASRVAV